MESELDRERTQERIVGLRETLHRHPPSHPVLQSLWQATWNSPQVLRESPHRTVFRVETQDGTWLLKICHPKRRGEILRNWLRLPPALREAEAAVRLGVREVVAEQVVPRLGLFARRWHEGNSEPSPDQDGAAWGRALSALHDQGWCDADLDPEDFLWSDTARLIPLDLGSAKVHSKSTPIGQRTRDLIRLLANLSPEKAEITAEQLCAGTLEAGGPRLATNSLLLQASQLRRRRIWRRGKRAWRPCSDFLPLTNGVLRHGFVIPEGSKKTVRAGRRSRVERVPGVYEKHYARPWWRTMGSRGPAAAAARKLHALELANIPATKILGWRGPTLWTEEVPFPLAQVQDFPALEDWLEKLHAWGFGMRDCKLENFCIGPQGAILLDGDGLTARSHLERDYARLKLEKEIQAHAINFKITKDDDAGAPQAIPAERPEQARPKSHSEQPQSK